MTHSQGTRHDFKSCRQPANDFAVKLDSHLFILLHRTRDDEPGQRVRHLIHAQVCAEVKTWSVCQNPKSARISNGDDVKESVVEFRVGSDLHPAAVIARIRDTEFS